MISDDDVLAAVSVLITINPELARLTRDLWSERTVAVEALERIRDWDLAHSAALDVRTAVDAAAAALERLGR